MAILIPMEVMMPSRRYILKIPWANVKNFLLIRDDMVKQMIQTRKRFDKYHKYAKATIHEVLTPSELSTAQYYLPIGQKQVTLRTWVKALSS
jgi:hypothetical protein